MDTNRRQTRGATPRSSVEIAALSDAWMTPAEAAAYVSLTSLALNQRRFTGTGPRYTKVGRLIRYRKNDLDAWLMGDGEQAA